jgi:hypothetical protein
MLVIGFRGRADDLHLSTYRAFDASLTINLCLSCNNRAQPMGTLLPGQLPVYNLFTQSAISCDGMKVDHESTCVDSIGWRDV